MSKPYYFDSLFYTPISYSNRSHKIVLLPNGLLTLLISDPTESIASCSLSVATGSHDDPKEALGLAHFCEHMILSSGNKKYQEPNMYHELLSKNNGAYNAFTTGEQTSFFFELPNKNNSSVVFDKLLDVFASSFKYPLFSDNLINKEIYAINNEHISNKSSMNKILYHATRLFSNKKHPFCQFSTGNFSTLNEIPHLNKIDLKQLLITHFKENFYAKNMCLVLKSSQSLNYLMKLAMLNFNDINMYPLISKTKLKFWPSHIISEPSISLPDIITELNQFSILKQHWTSRYKNERIFPNELSDNVIFIQSNKLPIVRFIFPINYKSTRLTECEIRLFEQSWIELFGDESEDFLSYHLKKSGMIDELVTFVSHYAVGDDALILQMTLTSSGWENVDEINNLIWNWFIPFIFKASPLIMGQYLSEINSIDLLKFLYQGIEKSSMDRCSKFCDSLLLDLEALDPRCILRGTPMNICNNYDSCVGSFQDSPEWWIGQSIRFQNFLKEFLTIKNVKIIMIGDLQKNTTYLNFHQPLKYDSYYEFEYIKTSIELKNFKSSYHLKYHFRIPISNPFLISIGLNLSLIKQALKAASEKSQSVPLSLLTKSNISHDIPMLCGKNHRYEMWMKSEESNLSFTSKNITTFELISTVLKPTPENTINLEILAQLLNILLSPLLYSAEKVGYTYEIASSTKGDVRLGFTLSGFSEGVFTMIQIIIMKLIDLSKNHIEISKQLFRKSRINVRKKYENASSANSVMLANLGLLIVLEKCMWTLEDRLDALENIDINSFKCFLCSFVKESLYLNLIIHGDLKYADKINYFLDENITYHLKTLHSPITPPLEPMTHRLKPGENLFVSRNGFKDDPNNSIVYFIQTGDKNDTYIYTLTAFTDFLISLTLIPDLRNKKQIGYLVLGGIRTLSDTVGIHITTMSGTSPELLEIRINEYLSYLERDFFHNLTSDQFNNAYLNEYITLIESGRFDKLENTSGPINLMDEIEANVHSNNLDHLGGAMEIHRKIKSQISNRSYNFQEDSTLIDLNLIKKLTKEDYMKFFKEKISIYSNIRSKISIMMTSPMSNAQIYNRTVFLQLELFLKLKGFKISDKDLNKIVEKSNSNTMTLIKELFTYFKSRGESVKLCIVILKELLKQITKGLIKFNDNSCTTTNGTLGKLDQMCNEATPAISLTEVIYINSFR